MRRLVLFISLCLLSSLMVAQNVKVDFNDGEFFLAEEEYEEALFAFGKVYNRGYQESAYINYRMGMCLINIPGRKTEAIPYLEKAQGSISAKTKEGRLEEKTAPPDALLYLGNAYRINMEVDKALNAYNEFAKYIDDKDEILKAFVDQQIVSCGNLLVGTSNPVEYKVGNLGQLRESHANRYNMVVSGDMQTMAFMGKNPFYNGVYVAVKEGEIWGRPMNITPSIASDGNMDVVALSHDGKKMLLAVIDQFTSNLYESIYDDNRWYPAESLGKPINSKYYESSGCYSADGKSIYFASNRKGTLGGMDIYRSDLADDGTWSEPVNLGPGVNTLLNEETPYMSPDGDRLYFSSQGHSTIGGFDVFYTELNADGSWNDVPVNLGYPLNTSDDDMVLTPAGIQEENTSFVFAKDKVEGFELLKFEMIDRNDAPVPVALTEPEEVEEVVVEEVAEVVSEEPVEVVPDKPAPPREYFLRPIYFDFESYMLSKDGSRRLDQLITIMELYPSIEVEITGHTDAKGTYEYNQRLSVNRAKAVYKYLILNDIDKNRLTVTGKSESEHVARNQTKDMRDAPEGRMLNRRVEFDVKVTEGLIIEMEKVLVPDHLKLDD